jgi:hypothetical protein
VFYSQAPIISKPVQRGRRKGDRKAKTPWNEAAGNKTEDKKETHQITGALIWNAHLHAFRHSGIPQFLGLARRLNGMTGHIHPRWMIDRNRVDRACRQGRRVMCWESVKFTLFEERDVAGNMGRDGEAKGCQPTLTRPHSRCYLGGVKE